MPPALLLRLLDFLLQTLHCVDIGIDGLPKPVLIYYPEFLYSNPPSPSLYI